MTASDSTDDQRSFAPTASWENLRLRADLLKRLRKFFEQRDFLEVETPLLSADSVIDRHLDPIPVTLFDDPRRPTVGQPMWLQTSPEFGMKRLLASGAERIYQVTRAFRGAERGRQHNPEFTIVEWYRVGDSMSEGIALLADFAKEMLKVEKVETISYQEAFEQHVGIDPHTASLEEIAIDGKHHIDGLPSRYRGDDRNDWLNFLLAIFVEPNLGVECPQILYDYPAEQAALARVRDDDPPVAERFELYVNGVELANGYHELLDGDVLRQRNRLTNQQRDRERKYMLPEASLLLDAMDAGLPACAGVALGFDRLVMVAAGAKSIDEVLAFPIDRA
ncbi:MAG: EF-P lysine aminoacylase GenX [Planctomycetaceae bacterium]|nr:EF-P lysine aminoacylase GenX [Planctomycetaceae bacterium]